MAERPAREAGAGRAALLVLCALALAGGIGCADKVARMTLEFQAMGGVPIHVTAWDVGESHFKELVEAYRLEVQRLESLMSTYRENSLLSLANRANGSAVHLDEHTATVLAEALRLARLTGGAFDPTVGPLVQLWKEAGETGRPPGPAELARALQRVGYVRARLSRPGPGQRTLHLEPGTALDLGGVAKGYFADVGVRWLRQNGLRRAIVELGGDLVAFDDRPAEGGRERFRIGVRHPFVKGDFLGVLHVDGGAIVTSGDYERGFEIAGRRYNHIIDPRSGQPSTGVHSVTLTAARGVQADALATGVLVLGEEAGLALVERTPGVEAILVIDDAQAPGGWRVVTSSGIGDRFERRR